MKRVLLIFALLFSTSPAVADWRFDGQYYWQGTQAYSVSRYREGKCGCYKWRYTKVYPQKHSSQSSHVSTVGDTLTITNNYALSQPAAVGGTTAYGYYGAGYSDLNLAAMLTQYGRNIEQGQQGLISLSNQFGSLIGGVAAIEHERGKALQILATGEAASRLASAVQPPPDAPVNIQSQQTFQGGSQGDAYTDQNTPPDYPQEPRQDRRRRPRGGGGIDSLDPLVAQHCASCHSQSGGQVSRKAVDRFDMDDPNFGFATRADGLVAAGRALTADDPADRMPLGVQIDDQTRGNLIQAFLHMQ